MYLIMIMGIKVMKLENKPISTFLSIVTSVGRDLSTFRVSHRFSTLHNTVHSKSLIFVLGLWMSFVIKFAERRIQLYNSKQ